MTEQPTETEREKELLMAYEATYESFKSVSAELLKMTLLVKELIQRLHEKEGK
jgi:hypothetical protein